MGTRSLTFVYNENNEPILNLYRQYDGYVAGHGNELAEFLDDLTYVNGLGAEPKNVFNGMGCLAAQLVAHFKDCPGNFYIHSVNETDCWQDYEYHIYKERIVVKKHDEVIFDSDWEDFFGYAIAKAQEWV